jgi:predicted membrane GTPase involved in stress response
VTAEVRSVERHHHQMAHARGDLVVTAGTEVGLGRLVGVNPADLDLAVL